jgi:hypothetical protein
MVREGPAQRLPTDYDADKARGGEIILRRPWQRRVFIGGLVGAVLLVIILRIIGAWSFPACPPPARSGEPFNGNLIFMLWQAAVERRWCASFT